MDTGTVVIAVATYKRPQMLGRLLDSIDRAACAHNVFIVVVDNDPEGSARDIVERRNDPRLTFILESRPGISYARNAAINAASSAEYIVFVDDDEVVSERWLDALLEAVSDFDADVVAGPVLSILNEDCPTWIRDSGLFDRARRPTGSVIHEAGSGNLLVKMSIFDSLTQSEWFNTDFGLSGGSDAELTRRLDRMGYRLVWCDEAVAEETVPPNRTTLRWLVNRYRRLASVDYRLDDRPGPKRTRAFVGGAGRVLAGGSRLVQSYVGDGRIDASAFRRTCRGFGFMAAALGRHHDEYAR